MSYRVLRLVMRVLTRVILGPALHVRGLGNVPEHGPALLVSNHVGAVDPPLTGAQLDRADLYYMAKSEHFSGLRIHLFRAFQAYPVVRNSADRASLRRSLTLLGQGHALLLYPEGSRSPRGLSRASAGAGFLARESRAPVVPVAIWGTEKVLPRGGRLPRRRTVHIVFGEPLVVPLLDADGRRMGSDRCTELVMQRVAALLPERYRGCYRDGTSPPRLR